MGREGLSGEGGREVGSWEGGLGVTTSPTATLELVQCRVVCQLFFFLLFFILISKGKGQR